MLGVVGFGFDAENCGMDVLGLFGEWQLNQEFGMGSGERMLIAEPAVHPSTLEAKDERSETASAGLKAGVQPGASW